MQDIIIIEHLISATCKRSLSFLMYICIYIFFCHKISKLWIKKTPMYRVHTNEKIEQFVDMMYISCDVLFLPNPLQNAQQH